MFTKSLSKYDKNRINDLKFKLSEVRKDYLNICECMFLHDLSKPNEKKDYVGFTTWNAKRKILENKMRFIIRKYEKVFVQLTSLCNVIEEEMNKGVY